MSNLGADGLSVIIPTHNGRDSVLRTVGAIIANDHPRLEVLIVSDGASARTRELISTITDPRVTLLEKEKEGSAAARNHGLRAAKFEWVAFIDDDDVPRANWLTVWQDLAHGNRVAITAAMAHWRDGTFRKEKVIRLSPTDPTMRASTLMAGCFWMRRYALLSIGGYDPTLKAAQNQDLGLRILDFAKKEGIGDECFVTTESVVIDIYAQEAISRLQRYGTSYAESALVFMERYRQRLALDPKSLAAYQRIISRSHRLSGNRSAAWRAAFNACRATPTDLKNYRSLVIATFPWLMALRREADPKQR